MQNEEALEEEPVSDGAGSKRKKEREDELYELEIQERRMKLKEGEMKLKQGEVACVKEFCELMNL